MQLTVKRPVWAKRPRAGLVARKVLLASKKSTIRFQGFGRYPGLSPKVIVKGGVDVAFKADVDRIIGENAELLRRLAK
jgi:hypothetical protein